MLKNRQNLISIAVIVLAVIFTYWKLPNKHFIGDEWTMISETMYSSTLGIRYAFRVYTHHFYPVYFILTNLLYKIAKLNPLYYAIFGMSLHVINSILMYILVSLFVKDKRLPLIAALLFAINYPAMEIVFSNAVYMNMGVGGLFTLLCLIFFAKSLQEDKHTWLNFSLSITALFLSFLGGEYSFFLYLFLPLWALLKYNGNKRRFIFRQGMLFSTLGLYFFMRSLSANKISGFSTVENNFREFVYKLWIYPFKVFSQTYIPRPALVDIAGKIRSIFHVPQNIFRNSDFFAGSWISHTLTIIFLAVVLLLMISLKKRNRYNRRNNLVIWIAFTVFSSFIYAVPSEVYHAFLQSRYYFYPSMGTSILLSLALFYFVDITKEKIKLRKIRENIFGVVVILTVVPMLLAHYFRIDNYLEKQARVGRIRESILDTIHEAYPSPREKSIFYTESNGGYSGHVNIMPFDHGFANILLTYYCGQGGHFGIEFFDVGRYFRDLGNEGYKEFDNRGFGYFRDFEKLLTCLGENGLSEENVYAFKFDVNTDKTTDITDQIRSKIRNSKSNIIFYLGGEVPEECEVFAEANGQRRSFVGKSIIQTRTVKRHKATEQLVTIYIEASSPTGTVIADEIPSVQYSKTGDYVDGKWSGLTTEKATFVPEGPSLNLGDFIITYSISYPKTEGMKYNIIKVKEILDLSKKNNFEMIWDKEIKDWRHSGLTNKCVYNNDTDVQRLPLKGAMYHSIHPSYIDAWYAARLFRHTGWIGARLDHCQYGNDSDTYTIPKELYGYKVVGVSRIVFLNDHEALNPEKIIWNEDGSWTIKLNKVIKKQTVSLQSLRFALWLSVTQFDISPSDRGIKNIAKTQVLQTTADGENDIFFFSLDDAFPSCLPIFRGSDRSMHIAYVAGVMTEIIDLINYPSPVFGIAFDKTPPKGSLIQLPILCSYTPTSDDKFLIRYDGYLVGNDTEDK